MSLHSICKLDGIPPRETIHRWIKRDPDFSRRYDEAREERGNFYGEKVAELATAVLNGDIDYNNTNPNFWNQKIKFLDIITIIFWVSSYLTLSGVFFIISP